MPIRSQSERPTVQPTTAFSFALTVLLASIAAYEIAAHVTLAAAADGAAGRGHALAAARLTTGPGTSAPHVRIA